MKKTFILSVILASSVTIFAQSGQEFWRSIREKDIVVSGKREIVPNKYKTVHLNIDRLKTVLSSAPLDTRVAVKNSSIIVNLPMPDGTMQRYTVVESPLMADELQASYPNIRTYSIHGIDDAFASGKLDVTEFGFHAMIRSPKGEVYIDPYCKWNTADYITYYTNDFEKPLPERGTCQGVIRGKNISTEKTTAQICAGTDLRTYRLAIACTGEYAKAATGLAAPTVAQTLAKVAISVNRVNGVYETEFSIRLVLVPTTTLVLYTTPNTGFTTAQNGDGSLLINASESIISSNIGNANFDIGHTFSTGGGGLAQLGCVCQNGSKASGITGSSSPVGDDYDIDYVAHEMGHQFGGDHTFASATGACSGNGNLSTSMEPGSGVSIMAYAGICSATNDLAPHSIPYFHTVSFDEIMAYSNTGSGNSCPVKTATGNHAPVVTGSANYVIPSNTPFSLTGSATDQDGDALTYQWEEFDAAAAFGNWNSGKKPFFRSYNPTTSPTRVFPKLSSILTGTAAYQTVIGEYLPNTAQTLKFRLTARDNKMGGGGVCYALTTVTVNAAGPFAVTSQSTTGISYVGNSTQTITWNVNGTNAAPVNCANVNIYVSADAGVTYSLVLANTANDGTEPVVMPNVSSTTCRVKVQSVGNIFFDLNDKDFTITLSNGLNQFANVTGLSIQIYPNPFSSSVKIDVTSAYHLDVDKATINVYDILGNLVRSEAIKLTENFSKVFDFSSLANGSYIIEVTDGKQKSVARLIKM